ncbi:MAG: hypothetical protein H5U30_05480, partial [Marinobacter sp.]|nr:hypothetical protein [Marinobacter sp.]
MSLRSFLKSLREALRYHKYLWAAGQRSIPIQLLLVLKHLFHHELHLIHAVLHHLQSLFAIHSSAAGPVSLGIAGLFLALVIHHALVVTHHTLAIHH